MFGGALGPGEANGRIEALPSDVELVYDADCPNVDRTRIVLRDALAVVGRSGGWRERVQEDGSEASSDRRASPTILVDGRDSFAGGAGEAAGCRLYVNGSPPLAELVTALEAAERRRRALAELVR